MANVIRLICPNLQCRKILSVPDSTRGKTVRCRSCGMKINIPAGKPSAADARAGATAATQ